MRLTPWNGWIRYAKDCSWTMFSEHHRSVRGRLLINHPHLLQCNCTIGLRFGKLCQFVQQIEIINHLQHHKSSIRCNWFRKCINLDSFLLFLSPLVRHWSQHFKTCFKMKIENSLKQKIPVKDQFYYERYLTACSCLVVHHSAIPFQLSIFIHVHTIKANEIITCQAIAMNLCDSRWAK